MGRVAQLVEHLVYTQAVGGSIPSAPTIQVSLELGFQSRVGLRPNANSGTPGEPAIAWRWLRATVHYSVRAETDALFDILDENQNVLVTLRTGDVKALLAAQGDSA